MITETIERSLKEQGYEVMKWDIKLNQKIEPTFDEFFDRNLKNNLIVRIVKRATTDNISDVIEIIKRLRGVN